MRTIFHGEVAFFEVKNIPKNAKSLEIKEDYYIVGESESHGNDHRISTVEDCVELYLTDEDKLFISTIGTEIYCPNRTRHATIELPAGKWEVGHAQEYDYFAQVKRQVRD